MEHSLKINEEIGYKKSIADVELNMASLYEKQGKNGNGFEAMN